LYVSWMWIVCRVYRELRHYRIKQHAMSMTVYSFGVVGVVLLLGKRGVSDELEEFLERITGGEEEVQGTFGDVGPAVEGEEEVPVLDLGGFEGEAMDNPRAECITLLNEAINERATDIHFEPQPTQMRVRCRFDGMLQQRRIYDPDTGNRVVSVLKVMAGMDVAEKRRAQDGSFRASIEGRMVDFRVSTIGTPHGEKLVLRVLDRSHGLKKLDGVGMPPDMTEQLRRVVRSPYGMLVVCGPTGSGKTTTLYAALQEVESEELNIITIENPIEYNLANVNQHSINEKAGITFASLLRTALRQDPDVLMVGEIRDKETAEIATQASMTGHFVYTTVHANDAVSATYRLINLGVQPFMIANAITAVLAQRLVRRLCENCKKAYTPREKELAQFRKSDISTERINKLYRPVGCGECNDTGYSGRIGVFEMLEFDEKMKSLIQQMPTSLEIREAAEEMGVQHLRQSALQKAAKGVTSVDEAVRLTR
ncbi:MAG: GspE/PulE family protein, partial [Planctomycetota bacterium]